MRKIRRRAPRLDKRLTWCREVGDYDNAVTWMLQQTLPDGRHMRMGMPYFEIATLDRAGMAAEIRFMRKTLRDYCRKQVH